MMSTAAQKCKLGQKSKNQHNGKRTLNQDITRIPNQADERKMEKRWKREFKNQEEEIRLSRQSR